MVCNETIYNLIGLISMVLALTCFLTHSGLELIGFILSIIYLGAILIFFIFVVMLIDLRVEDIERLEAAEESTAGTQKFLISEILYSGTFIYLDYLYEVILYPDFSGLERLVSKLPAVGNLDPLLGTYFESFSVGTASVGFHLYSENGAAVGLLGLLLLFSLYASLLITQMAQRISLPELYGPVRKS